MIVRTLLPLFVAGALVVACSGGGGDLIGDCRGAECANGSSGGSEGASSGVSSSGVSGSSGRSSGGRTIGGFPNDIGHPNDVPPSSSSSSGTAGAGKITSLDSLLSIRVGESVCGAAPGKCYDAETFSVDFAASKLTDTTCVELAGAGQTQNVDQTRTLSQDNLAAIKQALLAVRTNTSPVTGYDGPQWILEVTTTSGTALYAQTSGCGPQSEMTQIESGWPELWKLLQSM